MWFKRLWDRYIAGKEKAEELIKQTSDNQMKLFGGDYPQLTRVLSLKRVTKKCD